ncbi:MAG: sulfatase [Bacteroidota bacterium]
MKSNNKKLLSIPIIGLMAFSALSNDKIKEAEQAQNKPNILIIVPDDLGWRDVGYYGSDIKTPNIDKLAKSGIRLNQHYVMPTCTPTRVSLMTGKYPSRYGITGPDYGEVIDLGDPTLASILKKNGYFTAIAGKWHLGSPPYTPLKYGFQSSYGYFDGQIDPYTHEYKTETALTDRRSWHRNDEYLDEEGHVTDLLAAEAIRVIEKNSDKPFFLYVANHVPHSPLDEPDEWMSVYDDKYMFPSRKLFAASVTHMDDAIGKIIDALERTGQRENTLILFTSDNGGQHSWHSQTQYRGKYADKPHKVLGNNYPLRGWKGDLYEGGIRVPAFVNWPGRLEPGVIDFPVHISDWLPTLCELIGTETSPDHILDGQSIWPLLTKEKQVADKRPIYWKIRSHFAIREDNWKLLVNRNTNKAELYDLENDFRETRDLSETNPEKTTYLMEMLEGFKERDRN